MRVQKSSAFVIEPILLPTFSEQKWSKFIAMLFHWMTGLQLTSHLYTSPMHFRRIIFLYFLPIRVISPRDKPLYFVCRVRRARAYLCILLHLTTISYTQLLYSPRRVITTCWYCIQLCTNQYLLLIHVRRLPVDENWKRDGSNRSREGGRGGGRVGSGCGRRSWTDRWSLGTPWNTELFVRRALCRWRRVERERLSRTRLIGRRLEPLESSPAESQIRRDEISLQKSPGGAYI